MVRGYLDALEHTVGFAGRGLLRPTLLGLGGWVSRRAELGLLRADEDGASLAPQPGMDQVGSLVKHVSDAGLAVELAVSGEPRALPPGLDLAACPRSPVASSRRSPGSPRARTTSLPPSRSSPHASARSSSCSRRARRTSRSRAHSSSARPPRRPTYATSWPSSTCATGSMPSCSPTSPGSCDRVSLERCTPRCRRDSDRHLGCGKPSRIPRPRRWRTHAAMATRAASTVAAATTKPSTPSTSASDR